MLRSSEVLSVPLSIVAPWFVSVLRLVPENLFSFLLLLYYHFAITDGFQSVSSSSRQFV